MSTAELRKYRLTGRLEPSDELLATLMNEVARAVEEECRISNAQFQQQLLDQVERQRKAWEAKQRAANSH